MKSVTIINFGWSQSKHREGLSLDQMQAFDLIHDWYGSNPDMPFVLRGYAGTGKTFLVQRVIQSFQDCFKTRDLDKNKNVGLRVALCAPTHKARHVLDAMAQEAGLTVHISTLHSLLHVMPGGEYDENGKQQLKPNTYSREPYYHEFDLVIIDEASMLGQELFKLIPSRIPTIFMGDPAQLPPIEDNVDSSPIFQLPLGMELTQVMRYEGAIATYVTALRQNLNSQFPPRLQSQGNIEKMQFDTWIAAAIDAYKFSRSSAKILAWTNNQVNNLNQQIRAALYPGAEPIEIGEILFAKEPIFLNADSGEQKEIFMHSCAECEVRNFKEYSGSRHHLVHSSFKTYRIEIKNDLGKEASLSIIHPDSWDLIKYAVNNAKKEIFKLAANQRSYAWREYYEFLETYNLLVKGSLMNRLQYGYAITVHQSQGGTFTNCFVDTSNIFGCRDNVMRNKLLYVAYSRASQQLYCYSKW